MRLRILFLSILLVCPHALRAQAPAIEKEESIYRIIALEKSPSAADYRIAFYVDVPATQSFEKTGFYRGDEWILRGGWRGFPPKRVVGFTLDWKDQKQGKSISIFTDRKGQDGLFWAKTVYTYNTARTYVRSVAVQRGAKTAKMPTPAEIQKQAVSLDDEAAASFLSPFAEGRDSRQTKAEDPAPALPAAQSPPSPKNATLFIPGKYFVRASQPIERIKDKESIGYKTRVQTAIRYLADANRNSFARDGRILYVAGFREDGNTVSWAFAMGFDLTGRRADKQALQTREGIVAAALSEPIPGGRAQEFTIALYGQPSASGEDTKPFWTASSGVFSNVGERGGLDWLERSCVVLNDVNDKGVRYHIFGLPTESAPHLPQGIPTRGRSEASVITLTDALPFEAQQRFIVLSQSFEPTKADDFIRRTKRVFGAVSQLVKANSAYFKNNKNLLYLAGIKVGANEVRWGFLFEFDLNCSQEITQKWRTDEVVAVATLARNDGDDRRDCKIEVYDAATVETEAPYLLWSKTESIRLPMEGDNSGCEWIGKAPIVLSNVNGRELDYFLIGKPFAPRNFP